MTDVAVVAQVFVQDHIFVEITHVRSRQFMDVSPVDLPYRVTTHVIDVFAA